MALTLSGWSDLAQIGTALLTLVGVLISIWISLRTLREVDHDRKLRHKPYLAFVPGGHRLPVAFVTGDGFIPGVDRKYANRVLTHLPKNSESVVLAEKSKDGLKRVYRYGALHNYGSGAALGVRVTWVLEKIWIGGESFDVGVDKLKEPLYGVALNTMPSASSHIEPSQEYPLTRLPAFIVKDYDKKITKGEGHFLIKCRDIFENTHCAKQDFYLFTDYGEVLPTVHVTFGRRDGSD